MAYNVQQPTTLSEAKKLNDPLMGDILTSSTPRVDATKSGNVPVDLWYHDLWWSKVPLCCTISFMWECISYGGVPCTTHVDMPKVEIAEFPPHL